MGNGSITEIIANLWYLMDNKGFIYSLRAKLYVHNGNDEEKLKFLKERAINDYLVAQPFLLPQKYNITFISDVMEKKLPVIHITSINAVGGPQLLFEEAYNILEKQLPAQTKLTIPKDPLIVITPLIAGEEGNIKIKIDKRQRIG